ncbi:hypothetical protein CDAR_515591 [Caerostris darwini]|uniref:Uncharacterized protein n=1 Tax=Caerostris darwini TaxID=1538125 RepID=A0AAV4S1H2_9ARAC|nr:hypothetical protein CDAR_515591 [Caerostris darwini]
MPCCPRPDHLSACFLNRRKFIHTHSPSRSEKENKSFLSLFRLRTLNSRSFGSSASSHNVIHKLELKVATVLGNLCIGFEPEAVLGNHRLSRTASGPGGPAGNCFRPILVLVIL